MSQSSHMQGKLIAIHWPKDAAEVTMAVDTAKLQDVTAEIEDASGVTHRVEVLVSWDADYLIGKDVTVNSAEDGMTISATT